MANRVTALLAELLAMPLLCSVTFFAFSVTAADSAPPTNAPALSQDWLVRTWLTQDGLPQNTVYAIAQTRDGYLWVGTAGGLARFDGVRFRSFGLQDGLRSVEISALAEDRDGILWVGTRGGGFSRWQNGSFTTFSREHGLPTPGVEALAPGEKGSVYLGTTRGLARFRDGIVTLVGKQAGLPETAVRALLQDSGGALWVSFPLDGLYRGTNDTFVRVEEITATRNPVYSLCEDHERYVWAGGGNGNLWKLGHGTSQRFQRTNGVPFQLIQVMAQAKDGPLWLGTLNGGLHCFSAGVFQQVPIGAVPRGISARSILVDREGTLWVGSEGLKRLSPRLLRVWSPPDTLENHTVTSIAEDRSGQLWVCTPTGGIYRFQEGRFSKLDEPALAGHPQAYTALATPDGSIWAGGESFLYTVQPDGTSKVHRSEPIRNEALRAMCEDDHGVWIGTYYSALLRADTAGIHVVLTNGILGGDIRSLAREASDKVWIGTSGGLYLYEAGKLKTWGTRNGLLSATIQALQRDQDGTLWIGTLGGGLSRLKNGRISTITSKQGLIDDVVSQILTDDFGHLWLGCNRGIMRLQKGDLEECMNGKLTAVSGTVFGVNEGMLREQCSGACSPNAIKTRNGQLLFPTVRGIVAIDPSRLQETHGAPPRTYIDEVLLDGQIQNPAAPVLIAPGRHRLEVNYSAPSLRGADWVRFRYRLKPADKDWVYAGARRTASFRGLAPGSYVFRVAASDNTGKWSESFASIDVSVQPWFWQATWFHALVVALAIGEGALILGLIVQHRRSTRLGADLRKNWEQLAHMGRVAVLSELSGSVAHEVNQPLAAILNNAQAAKSFLQNDPLDKTELNEILSDIVEEDRRAEEIIRSIRSMLKKGAPDFQPLDVNKLVQQVLRLVHSHLVARNITVRTRVAADLPLAQGDPIQIQQVLLNLILNSCDAMDQANHPARELGVEAEKLDGSHVQISVRDNGDGVPGSMLKTMFEPFVTTKKNGLGMGLALCRSMITAHRGRIWASRNDDRGLTVSFTLEIDRRS